jgi:hypothetical protein
MNSSEIQQHNNVSLLLVRVLNKLNSVYILVHPSPRPLSKIYLNYTFVCTPKSVSVSCLDVFQAECSCVSLRAACTDHHIFTLNHRILFSP